MWVFTEPLLCVNVCLMVIWRAAAGRHSERKQIKCVFGRQSLFLYFPLTLPLSLLLSVFSPSVPSQYFLFPVSLFVSFPSCFFSRLHYLSLYLSLSSPVVTFHLTRSPLLSDTLSSSHLLPCHFIYLPSLICLSPLPSHYPDTFR